MPHPIIKIGPPVFAQFTILSNPLKSYALQWARHSPKSAPSRWGMCNPSNMVHWVHRTQHPKRQLDRSSCFPGFPRERPYEATPSQNCPFPWDDMDPRLIHGSLCLRSGLIISGQSNLTKRPHRRSTYTIPSYSPGCVSVHPI